jgi:hypothetical protein
MANRSLSAISSISMMSTVCFEKDTDTRAAILIAEYIGPPRFRLDHRENGGRIDVWVVSPNEIDIPSTEGIGRIKLKQYLDGLLAPPPEELMILWLMTPWIETP